MDKQMLKCDICGGTLKMQANREAVCESCGMAYSIESLKEKFNGLKVSVTGSNEDVEQWRDLLKTYIDNCDFVAAEGIVKKILEAIPNDQVALTTYKNLKEWIHFDVRNGVLVGYEGKAKTLSIPTGVKEIERALFYRGDVDYRGHYNFSRIVFPKGCLTIGSQAFENVDGLTDISLPNGIRIESHAFHGTSIRMLEIPEGAIVEDEAFYGCSDLLKVVVHNVNEQTKVSKYAFVGCKNIPQISIQMPDGSFKTGSIEIRSRADTEAEEKEKRKNEQRLSWQDHGLCWYCGGEFKGLFTKVCSKCGKTKDY